MRFLAAVLALSFVLCPALPALAGKPKTMIYTGTLTDANGTRMSGVFWVQFALHRTEKEKKQVWYEEFYMATENGSYQVELGKRRPIPQALDLTRLFLAMQIDGVEVQRVPVDVSMISGWQTEDSEGAHPSGGGTCSQCVRAERAKDCDKLGGLTVKQLVNTAVKKEITVGSTAHFTSAVGTGEGTPFRLTCPPGFVVTGLKGKAGDSIGNLQLVCSPLEGK